MVFEETSATTRSAEQFVQWLDEMEFTRAQAAKALGKQPRMIEYYESGYPVPLTVQLLMDALHEGYRPRIWADRFK